MPREETLYLHSYSLSAEQTKPLHSRFASLTNTHYALLLDSAGNRVAENQYSMMMWSPNKVITHEQGRTIVHNIPSKTKTLSRQDPIALADSVLDEFRSRLSLRLDADNHHATLPFQCGVAGLIGYDIARYYKMIKSDKPGYKTADLAIGLYNCVLIHCHSSKRQVLYYVSTNKNPDSEPAHRLPQAKHIEETFRLKGKWQANVTQDEYTNAIAKIRQYLQDGDCYQSNFSQCFNTAYTGNPYIAYLTLREHNLAPFSGYMVTPHGAIASVSPERFLRVDKQRNVSTKPIKGTRPRFEDQIADQASAEELLNSAKDRAENLMIVDLLRNDLSKHCEPHSVTVPQLFSLQSYAAVHHMVSTIEGKLQATSSALTLLKDAFPGGSITGAPKVRAMEIIDELEPHKRNIYCGSLFYNGWQGDLDSSICIRTLLFENNRVYCCAGGGIVYDSQALPEYQETFDKVAKILPVLEPK